MVGPKSIDITDYDQSGYDYTKFWQVRQYEDQAERLALKKLLPQKGESLIDLGGGFGRLTDLYAPNFIACTLFDYSQASLDQAQIRFGQAGITNVKTVKGDLYNLPFLNESFNNALMIRVIHHLKEPKKAFKEINRILKKDGFFILEFPNKVHLKVIIKSWLRGNFDFPKDLSPIQRSFSDGIFYNYHPQFIITLLKDSGFKILRKISVSNLRSPFLKKLVPLKILLFFENLLQDISPFSFSHFYFGPSIFLLCQKK